MLSGNPVVETTVLSSAHAPVAAAIAQCFISRLSDGAGAREENSEPSSPREQKWRSLVQLQAEIRPQLPWQHEEAAGKALPSSLITPGPALIQTRLRPEAKGPET